MIKVTLKYSCMNVLLDINANFVVVWSFVIGFLASRDSSTPFQSALSTYLSVRSIDKFNSSSSLICTYSIFYQHPGAYMSLYDTCMQCLKMPEEGIKSSGSGIMNGCQ